MADDAQNPPVPKKGINTQRLKRRWLALWPIALALAIYPVSNGWLRVTTLICIALLWFGILGFCWPCKWLRWGTLTISVLLIAGLSLPGHPAAKQPLRERYVHSLLSYEGTRYIWGGENRFGIDCSGLVRAGLINANFREGMQSLNPALVRSGLSLWWHDCSARALGEEYRQVSRHLFDASAINQLDPAQLQPGDFAVTDDGVHVMAYLGDRNWIEADPQQRRVLVINIRTTNVWFDAPVRLMRWRQLDETGSGK